MNLNTLFVKTLETRLRLINYQTSRWMRVRKPFWLGVAKSKMFVVREPKKIRPKEEEEIYQKMTRHYENQVNALLNFVKHENPLLREETEGQISLSPSLRKEISDSVERNVSYNAESAKRREERMKREMEEETKKAIEYIELTEENNKKQMDLLEEIVRKEKILSESYITPENIDEAIEECLRTVQCYDFAIDLNGKRYEGSECLKSLESFQAEVNELVCGESKASQ